MTAMTTEKLYGGRADGKKLRPSPQLVVGIAHEREHTDNVAIAREIASDHLVEDPDYYTKLAEIEKAGKAIPGMPGYFITRDGTVYSDRQAGGGGGRKAEMHKVTTTDAGHNYKRVVLMVGGKKTTKYVHDLVVLAYGGRKKRAGEHIRHLDGDTKNTSAGNLRPGSPKENGEDRVKHGTAARKSLILWTE